MSWDSGLDTKSSAYKFAKDPSKVIRVLAGPGTGKSFGLCRRVARLLEEGQNPKRILAVTFTRTAAQDLKNEIHHIGVPGAENVVAKTLHSFCFGLLNKRDIIAKTGRYPRPMLDFEQKPMLYDMSNEYGKLRDKQKLLQAFEAAWARLQSEEPGYAQNNKDRQFEREIKQWLRTHRAMLFGEMIIETYRYLRNNPQCPEIYQFDHILVDEYQDLNKAEQAVIDLLATHCNLAIIGDDDQSIYSFKHAHPDGIREFPITHPGCDSIDFDECRRCPKKVVSMASRLISNNTKRTLGDLHSFAKNQDGEVIIKQFRSLANEIKGISNRVYQDISAGIIQPEDVLILTPVRKIGYKVRDALVSLGVNAKSYFSENALSTDALKYSFSLFTLLANPDDLVSLRYLLGYGDQTFRAKSYAHLLKYSQEKEMSVFEVLDKVVTGIIKVPNITALSKKYEVLKETLSKMKDLLATDRTAFINEVAKDSPENQEFRKLLLEAIQEADEDTESDLQAWLQKVYSHIVERVSFPEDTSEHDHVRIMSLHASKGLSAKYVIVMSAIDELIPRLDHTSEVSIEKQLEEQRRLFYVAITRCKSSDSYAGTLIISSFAGLPGSEALQLNIPADPSRWKIVSASHFIDDFGETAPKTTIE